jgi:hypothetical protein
MWKVAASLGPGTAATAAQAALPAASKVLPYARWIALGTGLSMRLIFKNEYFSLKLLIFRLRTLKYEFHH